LGKLRLAQKGEADVMAIYDLGVQASGIGRHEEALEYLKKAISIKPDFSKALESMGNIYCNLGRYEDALSSYKKAMRLNTPSRDTFVIYSNCEILVGNAEAVISPLEELLRKDQTYLMAMFALAVAYLCTGRKEKGIELIKKVKDMNFTVAENLTSFAKMLISAKRPKYASLLLEAAMENNTTTSETSVLLAECHKMQQVNNS
jgi:tetratricopeptide (TPR) repeat protein